MLSSQRPKLISDVEDYQFRKELEANGKLVLSQSVEGMGMLTCCRLWAARSYFQVIHMKREIKARSIWLHMESLYSAS